MIRNQEWTEATAVIAHCKHGSAAASQYSMQKKPGSRGLGSYIYICIKMPATVAHKITATDAHRSQRNGEAGSRGCTQKSGGEASSHGSNRIKKKKKRKGKIIPAATAAHRSQKRSAEASSRGRANTERERDRHAAVAADRLEAAELYRNLIGCVGFVKRVGIYRSSSSSLVSKV